MSHIVGFTIVLLSAALVRCYTAAGRFVVMQPGDTAVNFATVAANAGRLLGTHSEIEDTHLCI